MKNLRTQINSLILIIAFLLVNVFSISAQDARQESRYQSDSYRVAFQTPKDSVKQADSTEQQTIYAGNKSIYGLSSNLTFAVKEGAGAEQISKLLATDEGMETFAGLIVTQLNGKNKDFQFSVLEKKRVQIAGLNCFKLMTLTETPGKKIRGAMFVIPVQEQKRTYTFIIGSADKDFDKWFSATEVSVNSFELLKTET